MPQMGQHQLPARAVLECDRRTALGIDQLGVHESPCPQVHAVLRLALPPQRHADVADAHRLRHARAPALLEHPPERWLAAARFARHQHPLDARPGQVDAATGCPLDQVGGIGGSQHRRLWPEPLDRLHQSLGVAGADGDVAESDPLERGQRSAGHERPRVVGRHDPLAGLDTRRGIAARRPRDPVVEITRGQRDVAGRTGGTTGRVDADDLLRRDAEVSADRVVSGDAAAQLGLVGERKCADRSQPACRPGRCEPGLGQLRPVEVGALEQVSQLIAIGGIVERELLLPRQRLDLGRQHRPAHGWSGWYSTASSARPAIAKPTGLCRSSAR